MDTALHLIRFLHEIRLSAPVDAPAHLVVHPCDQGPWNAVYAVLSSPELPPHTKTESAASEPADENAVMNNESEIVVPEAIEVDSEGVDSPVPKPIGSQKTATKKPAAKKK
jgi:hypothetical protein